MRSNEHLIAKAAHHLRRRCALALDQHQLARLPMRVPCARWQTYATDNEDALHESRDSRCRCSRRMR
eukprot:6184760-Pleurochrysis_carterae.AAC.1